jgi:hypothetical protein
MRQIHVRNFVVFGLLTFLVGLTGCVPPGGNGNGNSAPLNTNAGDTNTANSNTAATTDASIDTREPEVYQAKITFKAETIGETQNSLPQLSVDYARNGADRRFSFNVPGAGAIVYLDVKDKRYVILPDRKQYADISPDATGGVQVPSSLTPGEIVARLKTTKGYELIGDDTLNGRPVVKYRFAGSKATTTAAGTVSAESFVYVDKETGLPLRSETVTDASNEVKGVKGIKLVTEMSDLKTQVDPATFELPAGLSKVSNEEIKQKVQATVQLALALLAQMRQNQTANTTASPAVSPSASPAK